MPENNNLVLKLGIPSDEIAYILHAFNGYNTFLHKFLEVKNASDLGDNTKWVQAFYINKEDLENEIGTIKEKLDKNGQAWICWPKRSSGVDSDLSDNLVRMICLASGLVDVKVGSINQTWSGLKFVYRLKDR